MVTFSGRDGASRYANDFDKNNFGPRFGFAWRPRTSWVLRGGYALSYYGMYADAVVFSLFNGFARTGSFSSPDGGLTPAFQFSEGMPPIPPQELGPAFGAVRVGQAPRLSPDFFQRNHDTGYSQQWNFTVQKELPFQMALEAAYLANVGHKLGGQDVNINMIPLVNGRGPAVQSQTLRPFPQFNNVMHKYPPWGNSSYHALNVKLEKRYSSGLNLLTNYTWSKFLDNVQGNQDIGGGSAYTHIALRHLDKSYSGSDLRHRWVMSSIYDIPIGKGRRIPVANPVLNHVVGGWTLGAVIEARSGAPYNVVEQTNRTNTFSGAPRPNLLRDPTLDAGRPRGEKLDRYFDTGAFSQPGIGEFGDAARNVGFGPGLVDTDVSVNKRFPINERFQLVFRTDLLNLPNRPNFANPAAVRGRGDFGRIVAILPGSTGRNIQLNLRLEW